ncbi:hypothetical protein [Rhizobium leguminosarum]|uniref:hypothetical protein n=1 Tax=Rhizobium leguminosarum TaxID=384 RepID=UPI001C983F03|nr:hypothetical protein [Rhizobium leguminosarum]MBY5788669.1 hypothetical protein [Rhizobium leguminosarum]
MPRNPSTGVYSKPAGTTPSVGQVIDPVPWNALTTDLGNEITNSLPRDGSAPMVAPLKGASGSAAAPSYTFSSETTTGLYLKSAGVGAAVATGTEIFNWSSAGLSVTGDIVTTGFVTGKFRYAEKSGNYTAVVADNNATIRFTGAYTLALDDAATLGASWRLTVIAGGGDVTIDPDASETINGATTALVRNGNERTIYCDGTAFYAALPTGWEVIRDDTLVNVSTYDVTGLSVYRKLRIQGHIYTSVDAAINMLTSTNNGSSYDTGSNFYAYQYNAGTGVANGASSANTPTLQLSIGASVDEGADDGFTFDLMIENFNKAVFMKSIGNIGLLNTNSSLSILSVLFRRNDATARNAFRIAPGSGTLSGSITVEGWRG